MHSYSSRFTVLSVEHAAAARAEHVPRQFEQPKPRSVQERGNRLLFVEAMLGGEAQHVDAAEIAIRRIANGPLDRGNAIGVSRLPQHAKKGFRLAHLFPARAEQYMLKKCTA
jgi:hypothetical protein